MSGMYLGRSMTRERTRIIPEALWLTKVDCLIVLQVCKTKNDALQRLLLLFAINSDYYGQVTFSSEALATAYHAITNYY